MGTDNYREVGEEFPWISTRDERKLSISGNITLLKNFNLMAICNIFFEKWSQINE